LSGSVVDFVLYFLDSAFRDGTDVSTFRDILPDKFIGIFNRALLPSRVSVGEIDRDIQPFRDQLVLAELAAVVGSYGSEQFAFVRELSGKSPRYLLR
jgi:hypothetical protein